jgi:predicted phage terminase large subunit-like protein
MLKTLATQSLRPFSRKEVAQELLNRRIARKSLIAFTEYTLDGYEPASHHHLIAEALEAVERGEIKRLMINMPPRHGKSELASRRFPAWYLGRNPDKQIIAASYNQDLATDFGRDVRNIVNEPAFGKVFEVGLSEDSRAANRWNTDKRGVYVAAGIGTATTGRGAHILLIDDPVKDREEAESELKRERAWNWYTSVARTRLMPGGAIIVIQTRWHEDDLTGRLIEQEEKNGSNTWHKLILPAINEKGEALWPEWYPIDALQEIRQEISFTSVRDWESLYQQNPTPDEGTFFRREWFRRHKVVPQNVFKYGSSDYAVSEDKGDYTEHVLAGIDPDGVIYVSEDSWHKQATADVWVEAKLDLIKKHKPFCWFGEAGVIQKAVEPALKRRMIERKVYGRLEWIPSINDKPTRARALQARAAMGLVSLPEGPEGDRMLEQLIAFPAGKHDDFVDALGTIGRAIDEAHPAMQHVVKQADTKKTGYSPVKRRKAVGWR